MRGALDNWDSADFLCPQTVLTFVMVCLFQGLHNARRIEDLTLEEYHSMGFQADGLEVRHCRDSRIEFSFW